MPVWVGRARTLPRRNSGTGAAATGAPPNYSNRRAVPPTQPLPLWQVLAQEINRLTATSRRALRRLRSAIVPTRVAAEPPCNLREGHCSLEEITAQISLDPQSGKFYGWRARLFHSQGQFDLAIADYTRQIELGFEPSRARLARGICYRMTGEQEKALEDFHEAVWRRPRWTDAIIARAWTHFSLGNIERALDDANLAVDIEPDGPKCRLARARLLAVSGRFDKVLAGP